MVAVLRPLTTRHPHPIASLIANLIASLAVVALLVLPAPPADAQPSGSGDATIAIINPSEVPSPSEITVRLSRATPLPDTSRVIIGRDDNFADALASGLLQSRSPLLLVPSTGTIPSVVIEEIQRLGATSATILGGTAAISPDVEAQLRAANLSTERRAGGSRFETAIDVARREAPQARTIMLARAASDSPANPTAGFADALAAGGLAAQNGWPILLTSTGALTPATRDYLMSSEVEDVKIVGGTAAVSQAVEDEVRGMVDRVERIAGQSRFGTAVELAKESGAQDAGDVDRVVLVDGTSPEGFVGGFASAAHSALNDAPILLVDGIRVPADTAAFLTPGAAFAQAGDPVAITCVVHPLACDGGREDLGLVDYPLLQVSPPINSLIQPGQQASIQLSTADGGAFAPVTIKGSCLDGQVDLTTDSGGVAAFPITSSPTSSVCSIEVTYGSEPDLINQGYGYVFSGEARAGEVGISTGVFTYGTAVPSTPVYVDSTLRCEGPSGVVEATDAAYEASYVHPDGFVQSFALTSDPVGALPGDTCTVTADIPADAGRVLWGVYNWSDAGLRNPLVLGEGRTATFSFADLGTDVTDVDVNWILETHSETVFTAPGLPGDFTGSVYNPQGLDLICDGQSVGEGVQFPGPGAACEVASPYEGTGVLVVAPGLPLVLEQSTSFTTRPVSQTVAVYAVATGPGIGSMEVDCTTAPELPFSQITAGATSPAAPVAYHSFYGYADEELRFRADDPFGEGLDPTLTLLDPSGNELAFNDDGDSGLDSRIDVTLPTEGLYCLKVSGFGDTTGDYLLAADFAPFFSQVDTVSPEVPVQGYFYEGLAGERIIFEARALGFAPTDPIMAVFDGNQTQLAFDDDGGGFPNSRIEFVLPFDGRFDIGVGVFDQRYGDVLVEMSRG